MKYKNLRSFAHNFIHSFLSYSNYVDDVHVVEDLQQVARETTEGVISIAWLPELKVSPKLELFSPRVLKSAAVFQFWLPEHARKHGVQLEHIRELRLEMYRLPSHQLRCDSVIVDDRECEHRQLVAF
jgi:hypothetical protein